MVQTRITKMLSAALQADTAPLATHYGAVVGIGELGHEVVKVFILPVLRAEADRLETVLEGPLGNNTDRIAADHVKLAVLKLIPPVLKTTHLATDTLDDYRALYGYLGPALYSAVVKLRVTTTSTTAGTSSQPTVVTGLTSRSATLAFPQVKSGHVTVQSQRAAVHRPVTPTASQKYVLVAPPQSATAGRAGATQPLASSTSTVMRMMTPTCSAAAAPTKLVVVTVHSAAETATHSSLTPTYSSDTSII